MERRKGTTEFFEKSKRIAIVVFKDLRLLASLYLAQLIVWRTLRVRHKERVARKKNLKLISGGGPSPDVDKEMIVDTEGSERRLRAAAFGVARSSVSHQL
ncbi:MAG: hypothetical protein ACRD6N_08680 [Pyrinomonadaceae bacterium]